MFWVTMDRDEEGPYSAISKHNEFQISLFLLLSFPSAQQMRSRSRSGKNLRFFINTVCPRSLLHCNSRVVHKAQKKLFSLIAILMHFYNFQQEILLKKFTWKSLIEPFIWIPDPDPFVQHSAIDKCFMISIVSLTFLGSVRGAAKKSFF